MDDHTFEELIDERRRAWGPPSEPELGPVPAARAARTLGPPTSATLEDTAPLPSYRPERL